LEPLVVKLKFFWDEIEKVMGVSFSTNILYTYI
jgi:hypothetical protein